MAAISAKCPECDDDLTLTDPEKGEIVECPSCGVELEVMSTAPIAIALAPEVEEDWGE